MNRRLVALAVLTAASIVLGGAITITYGQVVSKTLGVGAASTWESFLDNQYCPEVDTAFGFAADTCDVDMLKTYTTGLLVKWEDETSTWVLKSRPEFTGPFTPTP